MDETQNVNFKLESIIPKPVFLDTTGGSFNLKSTAKIIIDPGTNEIKEIGKFLADKINTASGFNIEVSNSSSSSGKGNIYLKIKSDDPSLGEEGYKLIVTKDSITLSSFQPAGLFRGIQTIRQLFSPLIESSSVQDGPWGMPACIISDYPRFEWRSAMLDVARHFFIVKDVKRFIDLIAYYKINKLHLHLSDDQGWRIAIDSWSNLAAYGGNTEVGGGPSGYYTKADYTEIVLYAQSRYITIIPEIDMPGHTNAALASYAELNENGIAPALYTDIQVGFSALATRKEITYKFVNDVIKEISEITPGPYIHIGGDEAKDIKIDDYIYFIDRIQSIVKNNGKQMIGWEEISQAHLNSSTVAQHWASDATLKAIQQGCKIVMSPATKSYLDMKYNSSTELGQNWAGYIEVEDAYNWDPASQVNGISENNILGIEAPLWTETIKSMADIEFMVFPRLCCFAEIGWSQKDGRSWGEFKNRLADHGEKLNKMGVNFYYSPQVPWRGK
ncbi:MAG: beta-N-acetylhexosaminidase [Ignavibacteriaceae bacterium]